MRSNQNHLLTIAQVSDFLQVPVTWIYGRIHRGDLPFTVVRVGRYLRFRQADVEAFVNRAAEKSQ